MRVQELTPETLLSSPRRSIALPNPRGTHLLYLVSTHSFQDDSSFNEVRVMDIWAGGTKQIVADDNVHDAQWLPGPLGLIIYLRDTEQGRTEVKIANTGDLPWAHRLVATLDGKVENLKITLLDDGTFVLVMTGLVGDDGELWNAKREVKKSTGRVFDTPHVRAWDAMYEAKRYGLWYTTLQYDRGWFGLHQPLNNVLINTNLEPAGIYDIDDARNNFDISKDGIAFIARDVTNTDPRTKLNTRPFYASIKDFSKCLSQNPQELITPSSLGAGIQSNMRISPDLRYIGFLNSPNGDAPNRRITFAALNTLECFDALGWYIRNDQTEEDEPPIAFDFAGSWKELILTTQVQTRVALAHLKLRYRAKPKLLTFGYSVTGYYPYIEGRWDRLLVTSSSIVESCIYQLLDVQDASVKKTISSVTQNGRKFGLSEDMVSEIWVEGADELCIQALVVKPSHFDERQKYPWVVMPHGGPVTAWSSEWSTQWNIAAWAEQGYILILPNVSGSTGYGLKFARRINDSWGGNPYNDLVHLMTHLERVPYLDQSKAVLVGAGYGAYMVSWILGHDLAKRFCCAIWHGGIFNLPPFMLKTDSPASDAAFGGKPPYIWENDEGLSKFDPAQPELLRRWKDAPPTLVVHCGKDYRCPITEGLAVFETLLAQGVPSRFLTFEDEGHWIVKPANSLFWHRAIFEWMRRCSDGRIKRGDKTW